MHVTETISEEKNAELSDRGKNLEHFWNYEVCLMSCWTQIYPAFANSEEANWSGSALFAIQYLNL